MSFAGDFRKATTYENALWNTMEHLAYPDQQAEATVIIPKKKGVDQKKLSVMMTSEIDGTVDFSTVESGDDLFRVSSINTKNYGRAFADFGRDILPAANLQSITEVRFKDVDADGIVDIIAAQVHGEGIYTYVLTNNTPAVKLDEKGSCFYLADDSAVWNLLSKKK